MGKQVLAIFIGLMMVLVGVNGAYALQAGGVEIGDLETGSVVGQPFKELPVDLTFTALENIGGKKAWYPPVAILNLVGRAGTPVVIKVINESQGEHGFSLAAEENISAPTTLNVKLVLKPGETKYIGIPTSDLTYVTAGSVLTYKCQLHPTHLGGQLLIQK
ncbi:MAG TPA: hypothetical protein VLA99_10050 [Nitrospiraceae bacterium]|nr:hypothetical protein [Nitrospiraceae bacterium]